MLYSTLEDVPEPIREYYEENIVSEPTGKLIEEPYIYFDEEGVEQTGVKLIPESVDVIYINLKDFGEIQDNVERIISRGSSKELIEKFIGFVNNGIDKDFHDSYLEWLNSEPTSIDSQNSDISQEELDLMFAEAYTDWASSEPVRGPYKTLADYKDLIDDQYRQYLADTDWYVTRYLETGVVVPEEVTTKRLEARNLIS